MSKKRINDRPLPLLTRIAMDGVDIAGVRDKEGDRSIDTISRMLQNGPERFTVLFADEVRDFVRHRVDESGGFQAHEIPVCMPPFEMTFVEWRDETEDGTRVRAGCSAVTLDLTNNESLASKFARAEYVPGRETSDGNAVSLARWGVIMHTFIYDPSCMKRPFAWDAETLIEVGEDGRMNRTGASLAQSFHNDMDTHAMVLKEVAHTILVGVMAFGFANCRNVTFSDVSDAANPTDKWLKRTKSQRLTIKTLSIGGMTRALQEDGDIDTNGLQRALHICRGHFVHHTNYFGTGREATFWKPQHVRGNAKEGVVIKDYSINTPASI